MYYSSWFFLILVITRVAVDTMFQCASSTPLLLTYATKRGTLAVGSPFTKVSRKNFLESFENAASVQTHEIMNLTTDLLPIVLFYDE